MTPEKTEKPSYLDLSALNKVGDDITKKLEQIRKGVGAPLGEYNPSNSTSKHQTQTSDED